VKRLLLFDIDGTLLSTNGAARRAFHRALLEVYGTTGPISTHAFDGKTDPQIARELLRLAGFDDHVIDAGLNALWNAYLRELAHELAQPGHETRVYPGVRGLLSELQQRGEEVCVGLLTGNIARGAALKLNSGRIDHHFAFGAYGSDCEERAGLPAVAVARALEHTGRAFSGREVVIIGDTPQDVTCGQALGVFTIAVATGRHSTEDLLRAGADVALPDLSNTALVLESLLAV
jgi:phosphoglycolate phosphatase-like HAD superfamily hydrolase